MKGLKIEINQSRIQILRAGFVQTPVLHALNFWIRVDKLRRLIMSNNFVVFLRL